MLLLILLRIFIVLNTLKAHCDLRQQQFFQAVRALCRAHHRFYSIFQIFARSKHRILDRLIHRDIHPVLHGNTV